MTTKPSRLPDPRLPNPNVLLLQRQRQQVLPLPVRYDATESARRPGEGRDPGTLEGLRKSLDPGVRRDDEHVGLLFAPRRKIAA